MTGMTAAVPLSSPAPRSVDERRQVERVVVGVDGSAGSVAALRWALREARLRGDPVHAVFAWQFHPSWADPGLGSMFPMGYRHPTGGSYGSLTTSPLGGWDDAEAAVNNLLDAAIASATTADGRESSDSRVTITREAIEGHAANVLLGTVTESDLLVLGSRGHGEFAGALLGSISQHAVSHARCPVVVVPRPDRARG